MSDAIETVDVTDRATAAGWVLPDGWTVKADMTPDDIHPIDDDEGLTSRQIEAWRQDEWWYVVVSVWVQDADGRKWGHDSLGAVAYGTLPNTDEHDEIQGEPLDIHPLTDSHPIQEYDMIGNALRDAVKQLEQFGTPVMRITPIVD